MLSGVSPHTTIILYILLVSLLSLKNSTYLVFINRVHTPSGGSQQGMPLVCTLDTSSSHTSLVVLLYSPAQHPDLSTSSCGSSSSTPTPPNFQFCFSQSSVYLNGSTHRSRPRHSSLIHFICLRDVGKAFCPVISHWGSHGFFYIFLPTDFTHYHPTFMFCSELLGTCLRMPRLRTSDTRFSILYGFTHCSWHTLQPFSYLLSTQHRQGIPPCHIHTRVLRDSGSTTRLEFIRGSMRLRPHLRDGVQKGFYATPALSTRRGSLGVLHDSGPIYATGVSPACVLRVSQATHVVDSRVSHCHFNVHTLHSHFYHSTSYLWGFSLILRFCSLFTQLGFFPTNISTFIASEASAPVLWPNINKYV